MTNTIPSDTLAHAVKLVETIKLNAARLVPGTVYYAPNTDSVVYVVTEFGFPITCRTFVTPDGKYVDQTEDAEHEEFDSLDQFKAYLQTGY